MGIEGSGCRDLHPGAGGRPAVAGEALGPAARDGFDDPRNCVDGENHVVFLVGKIEISRAVEGEVLRGVEFRGGGCAAVTAIARGSGAREDGHHAPAELAKYAVVGIGNIKIALRVERHTDREAKSDARRHGGDNFPADETGQRCQANPVEKYGRD